MHEPDNDKSHLTEDRVACFKNIFAECKTYLSQIPKNLVVMKSEVRVRKIVLMKSSNK